MHRVSVQPQMASSTLAFRAHQRANLGNRLHGPDFIVSHHHANQDRVGSQRRLHVLNAHDAVVIYGQLRGFPSVLFQAMDAAANRRMLDCRSDDVPAVGLRGFAESANAQVVCFGAAGSENDFVRAGADKRGDLPPRAIDRGARFLAERVHARRVAELFSQVREHRRNDPLVGRRGGAVIEIDFAHGSLGVFRVPTLVGFSFQNPER